MPTDPSDTARVNARHHYATCTTGCTHDGAPPLGPPLDDAGPDTLEPGDAWPNAPQEHTTSVGGPASPDDR